MITKERMAHFLQSEKGDHFDEVESVTDAPVNSVLTDCQIFDG